MVQIGQPIDLRAVQRLREDGLRALHVARHGRRGRHFLLCRIVKGRIIEIGRIRHDQMDLQSHLPFPTDEDGE